MDSVVPAKECLGTHIDEAFLGSCNNGRIEDLRVGAELIKGKKVAPLVRFLVVPASAAVYEQALKEGIIDTFMESGAIVMNPNCSVCWGSCQGVIGENEVLITCYRSYAHPQEGVMIYKITYQGKTLVYATDKESYSGGDKKLANFARNCDLLIHDAQYTTEDYLDSYSPKQGYGHSTFDMAIECKSCLLYTSPSPRDA